jgi:hypothetical protein
MMRRTWTDRDLEIVDALTCRVRVLSFAQIAEGWPSVRQSDIRSWLVRIVDAGLLQRHVWNLQLPPADTIPLFTWKLGTALPDFSRLTDQVRSRWKQDIQPCEVLVATTKAAKLFGSSAGRIPPVHHRNHDLLLGAALVHYRRWLPELAARWRGEDAMPMAEKGVKNPDAFLVDEEERPRRVIESAGRYSREQLEDFHQYCVESQLSYELW